MKRRVDDVMFWDGEQTVCEGTLLLEGELVTAFVPAGDRTPDFAADERIDGRGKLAMPGFINAHTHLYSSLARGMALSGFAPTSFAQILEQLWWRLDKALDPESLALSARIGAMEAARCGITTLIDHHASPNAIDGCLDTLREEVCDRVGLRAALCYEVSDRDGQEIAARGVEENRRFLASLAQNPDPRCAGHFGLHASFTLDDETLNTVQKAIPENAGIHIHVAEGPEDEIHSQERFGMRVVQRLNRFGLLRPTSILAHCIHLNEEEKDLVADRGALVVHNPRSNMNNAVGAFDLDGFLRRNIPTGLGTDGLGANMLSEAFTAGLLQKHVHKDSLAGGFPQLDSLLFRGNPEIASRAFGARLGKLTPGGPADVVLVDYAPPTSFTPDTLLGHLLFGMSVHTLRVSDLFVAGRAILRNRKFVDIDEAEEYAQSRDAACRLWKRIV